MAHSLIVLLLAQTVKVVCCIFDIGTIPAEWLFGAVTRVDVMGVLMSAEPEQWLGTHETAAI